MGRRIERHLDTPPFNRALWGILVVDERGRELYSRNADRLFVPASNTKLVVTAAALALLPAEGRRVTSVYGTGPIVDGILDGDLVVFGRGDPSFSARCYGIDTLAVGACDSLWTNMDALAAQVTARGVRHVTGAIVGDGSYFDSELVHPAWEQYDLNWWYAAPVSGLGFNDNSLDVTYAPGPTVGAPAHVSFAPDLGTFVFENRSQTLVTGARRTIDFFRQPGSSLIWADGGVAVGTPERTEYFAVPDPNRFFASAFRAALARHGVSIGGPTLATHDPFLYRACRGAPAIAEVEGRPLSDLVFPVLNSSQNWFAEMLLKTLGKEIADTGSWRAGLEVERRFLVDSVGIDSTAFALSDGSGLSSGNLLSPRAIVQLLTYMQHHPMGAPFVDALPRAGQRGSLQDRFVGTPLDGRVVAKTGSIFHVNTLSGYVTRPDGKTRIFSVMANNHAARYTDMLARIDSIVSEMGR
jgi:D-alanyl-D-alanine carboxypeptidase/D-alanyl-D-alanine-endopeptidase (penicillin-binding protein 4)